VVDSSFRINASSGFYGGSLSVYPIPDLALTIGANSEFNRATGTATLEFQPNLFARRNVAFFINGDVGENSTYSVRAGIRFYFGPDKPLIRRHRDDDPTTTGFVAAAEDEVSAAIATLFAAHGQQYQTLSDQAAQFHQQFISQLP
jgi:hypothetical protein